MTKILRSLLKASGLIVSHFRQRYRLYLLAILLLYMLMDQINGSIRMVLEASIIALST